MQLSGIKEPQSFLNRQGALFRPAQQYLPDEIVLFPFGKLFHKLNHLKVIDVQLNRHQPGSSLIQTSTHELSSQAIISASGSWLSPMNPLCSRSDPA
ncbi:MAG: hypothetical protein JNL42_08625 [Anaerolineae bacterium]|nr:hypothetical protein [Anaerolineae bacterium]